MGRIEITSESRVTRDPETGAIRTWFDSEARPMAQPPFTPSNLARQVLQENRELFGWPDGPADLREHVVLQDETAFSVRLTQEFKGIPVDVSEVVVNTYTDGRVYAIYNNYHYDIPAELDPRAITMDGNAAGELLERLSRGYERREIGQPQLIIYQYRRVSNRPPKPAPRDTRPEPFLVAVEARAEGETEADRPREGQYFLTWDQTLLTHDPENAWRVLVDAMTGRIIQVIDLVQYATGKAQVFDPNPIVTSGNINLRHDSPAATLNGQRVSVNLDRLDAKDANGKLHLDGQYVHMQEIEAPAHAEPVSAAGDFSYDFDSNDFLDAMAYFHIDGFQDYIQKTLKLTNCANYSIAVDAQAKNGDDNSGYRNNEIKFGGGINPAPAGNPVPDAQDAMVILHEYGHAIQDNVNSGFDNPASGVGEGFCDFIAAVHFDGKHATPANTRGRMMSWDSEMGAGSWLGRRYDGTWLFDGPEYTGANDTFIDPKTGALDPHFTGQVWATTMFELYRKLGGDCGFAGTRQAARDLIIRLHLVANSKVPSKGATAQQMAQEIEAADSAIKGWRYANGLHKKVIYDTFRRRHLAGYADRAVDVYINDGREGGYGSPSGNDLFTENLWPVAFWDTHDIWTRGTQYADAAAQAAGGPADHVEPTVGVTACLYVRVKNRGTQQAGSGPVTVRAYYSLPGMGLDWPKAWTPLDTPSIVVNNIQPGPANGVVVGPFLYKATQVGHQCVLVILECEPDRAVTQSLSPADVVVHSDLVPFDNNIAQRNLFPVMPKLKTKRGIYVRNPYRERQAEVMLHYDDRLPEGWTWETGLPDPDTVPLPPGGSRWVDITIDQAQGAAVTQFERPYTLMISGTVDDRLIGGVTFYIAPESAFARQTIIDILAGLFGRLLGYLGFGPRRSPA